MTFRKEIKLKINSDNKSKFIKELINKDFKEIYPKRIIESIYFDNHRNFSFLDSEEGIVPRKKIRLRRYINNNNYIYTVYIHTLYLFFQIIIILYI